MQKSSLELLEIDTLKRGKNLLAFSAGVDSTALLFLLRNLDISVDLALVNYGTRESSDQEESYARELAKQFGIKIYTAKAPKFTSNFEAKAREFRYSFFEELIYQNSYQNLITAHHLGDRLEWFLMRFIKGAGAVELVGMDSCTPRQIRNQKYSLIRPLLNITKDALLSYLEQNGIRYFIDSSNFDQSIERNLIREQFANRLLREYESGIKRSFEYLSRDKEHLLGSFREIFSQEDLVVFELENLDSAIRATDIYLKERAVLMSSSEKDTLLKNSSTLIGRNWVAEIRDNLLFIAPYLQGVVIPKKQREYYRKKRVPPKVRAYIFKKGIDLKFEE